MAGGTTKLNNFLNRLHTELKSYNTKRKQKMIAPANRAYSAWIGGSTLVQLKSFTEVWLTKSEWKETKGAAVFKMKGL